MRHRRGGGVLGVAVLAIAVTACASRSSLEETRREVEALSDEIRLLRSMQESTGRQVARLAADVRASESKVAGLGPQMAAEAANVRWLGERVEEVSREVKRAAPLAADDAPPPAPGPAASSRPSGASAKPARSAPIRPAPSAERAFPTPQAGEQAYAAALEVLQAGEHGQAVLEFLGFLARYPDHPLAGRSQYWIGEAYFEQGDYRQALTEYRKVTEKYGADPDALLKIGLCYARLNDPARAREAWQQVLRQYPQSDAAEKARVYIRPRSASSRRSG